MAKLLRGFIGFFIALFLIRYVVTASGIDVAEVLRTVDRTCLAGAFLAVGVGFLIAAYRWYVLLHHIRVPLALSVVLRLALIGQFFNLFVPGGVGGDLIKMFYLRKEAKDRFAEAALTVLLDRIVGLVGLLFVALLAMGLNPGLLRDSRPEMRAIQIVVLLAASGALFVSLIFLLWPYLGRTFPPSERVRAMVPERVLRVLERVAQAFSLLRSAPSAVLKLLILAMFGHFFATFGTWMIGQGTGGVEQVSLGSFLLITQLSNLVAAVPITPGGLGGRDLAMSFLLNLCGASTTAQGAVPLVTTALLIVWSAFGGLALLWEKRAGVGEQVPGDSDREARIEPNA